MAGIGWDSALFGFVPPKYAHRGHAMFGELAVGNGGSISQRRRNRPFTAAKGQIPPGQRADEGAGFADRIREALAAVFGQTQRTPKLRASR